ncbi:hypothetical protein Tdes44962_MAKER03766 [Teratosphaeria destructans]|uniref:Uncharacterized protein n=1 Tax=Teratosphaeria destructans TaxID=418781 RepID=A0A9W7SP90_9PEZI|nr:hypothetical protein Tdes44962_MAKER03766 [Teratosphaeria destructans]
MAAGPDSAYGASQHGTSLSGHKESAARPQVVPVPTHGQLAGVSSDRNLAVNQDTGEGLDDDTGEVVTTVTTTTTTTTTTRTRRGQGPGVSPAPPSSQATPSSDGSYFAATPGHSSATSGSQTLHAQSRPSDYTAPEQEQLPVVSQNVGPKAPAGYPAVPNVVVNDRPVSPRPGQSFSYPGRQVVDEDTDEDGRAGPPPISVPELEPPSCPAATRRIDANSTNGANAASRTPAASGGTRWEALEEIKAAGKLAAPEAKNMLQGLEAFAIGMHAVGKKLEPTFHEFDRR